MAPSLIYCLRHGEKPGDPIPTELHGFDQQGASSPHSLTATGWQRAGALAATALCGQLAGHKWCSQDQLLAPDYPAEADAAGPAAHRAYQTVLPLAQRFGVLPTCPCACGQPDVLRHHVLAAKGIVVVCWEHKDLADFVALLLDDPSVKWPHGRFDVLWALRPVRDGSAPTYQLETLDQRLLARDLNRREVSGC